MLPKNYIRQPKIESAIGNTMLIMARDIMKILAKQNVWRKLTFAEFQNETGIVQSDRILGIFYEIVEFTVSEEKANGLDPDWGRELKNPDSYQSFPLNSRCLTGDTEKMAQKIMKVLTKNSNTWRTLSFAEYLGESTDSSPADEKLFIRAVTHTSSSEVADDFCDDWGNEDMPS